MFLGTNILYSFSQMYCASVDHLNYVKAHPGDLGMENMKLTIFSYKLTLSVGTLFKKTGQLQVQGTVLEQAVEDAISS